MEDVTDLIEVPPIFDELARQELKEQAAEWLNVELAEQVLQLIYPEYTDKLCESIVDVLLLTVEQLAPEFDVERELHDIVGEALEEVHRVLMPPRSYPHTFLRQRTRSFANYTRQLDYLRQLPQPAQRTPEWYAFRANVLTASNVWKAFGTESMRNQLIYEKCRPYVPFASSSTDSPMHWGQRYEPVSVQLYEEMYATHVGDFGCIPHPTWRFLAASPDGINIDPLSPRYGRMLEIKNIVNRDITGIPKLEYWVQMQVQMEVCDLNECDFLETRFKEYESLADFEADSPDEEPGSYTLTHGGKPKGVIVYFSENGQPKYEYAPRHVLRTPALFAAWEEDLMARHSHLTWITNLYWRLDELSCVLVLRNKAWFRAAVPILQDIWAIIEKEKVEGFEHRAPQSRASKSNVGAGGSLFNGQCFFNILKLDTGAGAGDMEE